MKKTETGKCSIESNLINLSVIWVRVADSNAGWNRKSHFHAFYELHVALSGECRLKIQDTDIYLEQGKYILIPPRICHSFLEVSTGYREFVVGVYVEFTDLCQDGRLIRDTILSMESIHPIPYDTYFEQYIKDCLRYKQSRSFASGIAVNICLLFLEIAKQVMQEMERKKSESDEKELVDEIKFFISSNLAGGIDTKSVASYFNISERHLNRLLKAKLQKSVNDLIMDEKINGIKRFLETSDLTLENIAELVGFTNSYNMSRAFKRREGLPPGEYRKALRKK